MGVEPTYNGFANRRLRPLGYAASSEDKKSGASGIRTRDLLHAMQALSQLSYGPKTAVILA